jgi:hypothetical protein
MEKPIKIWMRTGGSPILEHFQIKEIEVVTKQKGNTGKMPRYHT